MPLDFCDEVRRKDKDKILNWIKEHEFTEHQGGWLIHADDLEEFIKKLFANHAVSDVEGKS